MAAGLLLGASVTPSLYPRPWLTQALLSGVTGAAGYGLGAGAGALWRRRMPRFAAATRSTRVLATAAVGIAVPVWALIVNYRWQIDVRELMGVQGSPTLQLIAIVPVAAMTGYFVVVAGRLARMGHSAYLALVSRFVPQRGRLAVRLLAPLLLAVFILDVVVAGHVVTGVRNALVAADARSEPTVVRPDSPSRSGGPASLIAWDTLGSRGRRFVAQGPNDRELAAFSGAAPLSPIRVYAGLSSAASNRERAELAVAELERAGAFEREILVIVTPTGTGSVNAFAIDPLEYMYNGDTAAVAMQYSYSPSWLTMLGNQERAKRSAQHLFDAVTTHLRNRPGDAAPKVLLYGESLGSFGSESIFDDIDDLRGHADGVLWVGPPRANRLWREITANRDAGSPVWHPVYRGGRVVRFGWDGASLSRPAGPWGPPRIAYLQHASDPITWWTTDLLFDRPEWMREPRGPDISRKMPYLPVVTFWQTGVDMVLGANAPLGHGHMYGPEQAEAWALIAPPEGWAPEDTRRLVAALSASAAATED